MTKLLSQVQAQHIASALTTLNNVAIPYFRTAFTKKVGNDVTVIVFEWIEARETQVSIYECTTDQASNLLLAKRGYKFNDLDCEAYEGHADQNAFLEAYGV
ncbi:hypothetical protein [Burkholderia phage BCSR5]|nr:hypothetical protein [Burkholderia phage BCSR5]